MLSAERLPSQQKFSNKQGTNKGRDNRMKYGMESVKQQTFTLRIAGVHSLLKRGVHNLLTGIIKNLVLHGKERFCDKLQ